MDFDAQAFVAELAFVRIACLVEDNPSIDLLDSWEKNPFLVNHSYMIKNLYCPLLFVEQIVAFLLVHSSQKKV